MFRSCVHRVHPIALSALLIMNPPSPAHAIRVAGSATEEDPSTRPFAVDLMESEISTTSEVEGDLHKDYLLDTRRSNRQTVHATRFGYRIKGYGYHPTLLTFDGSVGLAYLDQFLQSTGSPVEGGHRTALDYRLGLQFLKEKHYPFNLIVHRSTQSYYTGKSARLLPITTGVDFHMRFQPLDSPLRFLTRYARRNVAGRDANQVVRDEEEKMSVEAIRRISDDHTVRLEYEREEGFSRSGNLGLPIRPTTHTRDVWRIETSHRLGEERRSRWANAVRYTALDRVTKLRSITEDSTLAWVHSPALTSRYNWNYGTTRHAASRVRVNRVGSTVYYEPIQRLRVHGQLDWHRTDASALDEVRSLAGGGLLYSSPFDAARLELRANIDFTSTDLDTARDRMDIFAERLQLSGITPVALRHLDAIPATIDVTNSTATQSYVEGIDYAVSRIGRSVEIYRLPNGRIEEGESVLVDYAYDVGVSGRYSTVAQNYQARLTLSEYFNATVHYRGAEELSRSGMRDRRANSFNEWSVEIAAFDYPVTEAIAFAGSLKRTEHSESISSYSESGANVQLVCKLPFNTVAHASAIYTDRNNVGSRQDIERITYRAAVAANPGRDLRVVAEINSVDETGGTLDLTSQYARLAVSWQVGALSMSGVLSYREALSERNEQGRTSIRITIARKL